MMRWIYIRTLLDKYRGPSFHLSVTADSGGAAPSRVIENREELLNVLQRARLERLMTGILDAQSMGEVFSSGPLEIDQEQEDVLLGRS